MKNAYEKATAVNRIGIKLVSQSDAHKAIYWVDIYTACVEEYLANGKNISPKAIDYIKKNR